MGNELMTSREVHAAVRRSLEANGFRLLDRGSIYLLPLTDDVDGWVSIITETAGGVVQVSPKIGVRHERLHVAIDSIRGDVGGREPSVSVFLGYLMPQRSANVVWSFDDPALLDEQARDLSSAIIGFGGAYMADHSDLERIVATLRESVPWEYSQIRIPVALTLLGRREEANDFVESELANLQKRSDAAAMEFREFASRFESWDAR